MSEKNSKSQKFKNLTKFIEDFSLSVKKCYCIARKNTESKNRKVARTKNRRIMLLSKCAVCDSRKSEFIKEQETRGLLSSLGIKTSLSKIPLVGPLLF